MGTHLLPGAGQALASTTAFVFSSALFLIGLPTAVGLAPDSAEAMWAAAIIVINAVGYLACHAVLQFRLRLQPLAHLATAGVIAGVASLGISAALMGYFMNHGWSSTLFKYLLVCGAPGFLSGIVVLGPVAVIGRRKRASTAPTL